jgi:hypothetical protein
MENLYQEFISRLKLLYGAFDETNKKFEKAPNSEISRDLGYSDAQFSRLINCNATDGEYQRANQNAERILKLIAYEKRLATINVDPQTAIVSLRWKAILFLIGLVVGGVGIYLIGFKLEEDAPSTSRYDMLKWAFESNFVKPYKGIRDLPADCNYESYRYQGRWELKNEYKLPFLRESSGFHYLAKSVEAYIRSTPDNNPGGKLMQGYEYQEHEIWYDILERPINMFIREDGEPLASYDNLVFTQSDEFVKIGTVHSFYTNTFNLDSAYIYRQGQDIGRDIEFVSEEDLESIIHDKSLLNKIKREMTQIVQDPLRDFSRPSQCDPASKPSEDFHAVKNGDEMVFHCRMSTAGRFPINYTKTYVLKDQFIKERCHVTN